MPKNRLVTYFSPIHPRKHVVPKLVLRIFVLLVADGHAVVVHFECLSRFDVVILAEKRECGLAEFGFIVVLFAALPEGLVVFNSLVLFFGEGPHPDHHFETLALIVHRITNN